jgi:hypothetical protein
VDLVKCLLYSRFISLLRTSLARPFGHGCRERLAVFFLKEPNPAILFTLGHSTAIAAACLRISKTWWVCLLFFFFSSAGGAPGNRGAGAGVPLGHSPTARWVLPFSRKSVFQIRIPYSVVKNPYHIVLARGVVGDQWGTFYKLEKKIHGIHKNRYSIEIPWNPYSMGKFHGIRTVWI